MDHYAIIGNPVEHSLSPRIHNALAAENHEDMFYDFLPAAPDAFLQAAEQFRQQGGKGLGVTLPFKKQAYDYATKHTERAEAVGVASTLMFCDDGSILADNTDGAGFMRDLTVNHKVNVADQRVLILGAGGAAEGILPNLIAAQPAQLVIANRTLSKAQQLCQHYQDKLECQAVGMDQPLQQQFDLVVNTTSLGHIGQLPALPVQFAQASSFYDLTYAEKSRALQAWALAQGASQVFDGLGMLIEHCFLQFELWRGHAAPSKNSLSEKLP